MRTWKKALSLMLALSLVVSLCAFGASAETFVAQIGSQGYPTLAAAVGAARSGDTIALLADAAEKLASPAIDKLTIDLGGHTFTMTNAAGEAVVMENGRALTIQNGSIVSKGITDGTYCNFQILTGSAITLDRVDVDSTGTVLLPQGDAASVTVKDSAIRCGVYAVGTNAAKTDNYHVVISLENSTFTSTYGWQNNDGDSCPVMINVPGTLRMTNCTVNGTRQGVMVRGGTATIQDSTINLNPTYAGSDAEAYWNASWGQGDNVPMAAVLVGNRSTAYAYGASCTLENTRVSAAGGKRAIYVYAMNDTDRPATLEISGASSVTGAILRDAQNPASVSISGGDFTADPAEYLAPGYLTTTSTTAGFAYTVSAAPIVEVKATVAEPKVAEATASESIPQATVAAINEAAGSVAITDDASKSALTAAANDKATAEVTETKIATAITELKALPTTAGVAAPADIAVVGVTYFDITPKSTTVNSEGAITSVELAIKPMCQLVATTAEVAASAAATPEALKVSGETGVAADAANAVKIGAATEVKVVNPVTVSVKIPASFPIAQDQIQIKHVKDSGAVYYYTAAVAPIAGSDAYKLATFTILNGFSSFTAQESDSRTMKVTFLSDGGSAVEAAAYAITNVGSALPVPTKAGYTFAGWTLTAETKSAAGVTTLTESVWNALMKDVSAGTANYAVSAKASWTQNVSGGTTNYTLRFDTNGGSAIASVIRSTGTTVDLAAYTPTRSGYTFAGWYSDSELSKAVASVKLTANTTVYAKWSARFADVKDGAYYYDAVLWAVGKGVTTGATATAFAPDAVCTRAQTVTFLWRAMGSPAPTGAANPFTDVAKDAYYYKAVLWAVEKGIAKGATETTFAPDAAVTRGQVAAFLHRAAGAPAASGSNPFTDVAADAYYGSAVLWAVSKGITEGTSATTFSPANPCTRGQIVAFLYRYLGK